MILELIMGIVIAAFLVATIAMEIKNRNKKSDLFTNIVISVIGFGASIYILYNIFQGSKNEHNVFDASIFFSEICTWIYILVILLASAFTVVYLTFYFKNKDLPDTTEEEYEDEEEKLSDDEIEEILEQENNETNEENKVEEDDEEDGVVLESLTAQKPKVLKPDEEEFKFKEGATQVPTTQRNPFEKK